MSIRSYGLAATPILIVVGWAAWLHAADPAAVNKQEIKAPLPIATSAAPAVDATELLRSTEPFVRPPRVEDLTSLANELAARGQERAAKSVLASVATTADDFDRLVRRCLQFGQNGAADALLQDWERKAPADGRLHLLRAVRYESDGEAELAQRELQSVRGKLSIEDRGMAELLGSLVRMQRQGKPPGVDANPWGVRFVGNEGSYAPGDVASVETKKLPAGALDSLSRLVRLLPRQGNLWALLGELFNAAGNPQAGLACMERAELLLYSPALLRDHRRVLAEHRRTTQQEAERKMAEALNTSPAAEPSVDVEGSRARVTLVLIIGSIFITVIVALQIREWRRSASKRT